MMHKIWDYIAAIGVLLAALIAAAAAAIGFVGLFIFGAFIRALPYILVLAAAFYLAKWAGVL
jgi:hypothetical protein